MISVTKTPICKLCMTNTIKPSLMSFLEDEPICSTCLDQFEITFFSRRINGVNALSIYQYNDAFKETLYRYKAKGDIELAQIFLFPYRYYLKLKYEGYIVVAIPSTKESDDKRGFNHVHEAFKTLGLPFINCIQKKIDFKQSDYDFAERQKVKEKLSIEDRNQLRNKKVLIVDDLITTGATMKAVISLIQDYHPKRLKILTLSYTKLIDK